MSDPRAVAVVVGGRDEQRHVEFLIGGDGLPSGTELFTGLHKGTMRCHRGHENPAGLWNCPTCTDPILDADRRAEPVAYISPSKLRRLQSTGIPLPYRWVQVAPFQHNSREMETYIPLYLEPPQPNRDAVDEALAAVSRRIEAAEAHVSPDYRNYELQEMLAWLRSYIRRNAEEILRGPDNG